MSVSTLSSVEQARAALDSTPTITATPKLSHYNGIVFTVNEFVARYFPTPWMRVLNGLLVVAIAILAVALVTVNVWDAASALAVTTAPSAYDITTYDNGTVVVTGSATVGSGAE